LRTETYYTKKQRREIVRIANANDESVIHDNFYPDGRKELVLDVRESEPNPLFLLQKELVKNLENDTLTFKQLKIMMRIERGLPLQQTTLDKLKSGLVNFFNQ